MTPDQLDHFHDEDGNSIGALLAHMAAVERGFQLVTFEEREPTAAENIECGAEAGGQGAP